MLYQALVPSFINSVSIPESHRVRWNGNSEEWQKKNTAGRKVNLKTDQDFQRLLVHLNPAWGADVVVTHTYILYTNSRRTHPPLLPGSNLQRAGPRSTPVAKKTGSTADTCAEERKSKRSQLPLLSFPHPSAAAVSAFIVPASSARHLTFNSSNAWPSPGPRDTALVYSSDLTNLTGRG